MSETPLGRRIAREIREAGPMSLGRYMALCLGDPVDGYYMTRDPLGACGDFITAPEISQMFGELIGLWAGEVWRSLGAPERVRLIELGPGRGTLMADALRAARVVPQFLAAIEVHLVETSPVLREAQRRTLGACGPAISWHGDLAAVPPGPMIAIANEFFDALPVLQFEKIEGQWRERVVVLDDRGALALAPGEPASHGVLELAGIRDGAIAEWAPAREETATALAARLAADPGAALVIDYGHAEPGFGDTLQAVAGHRPVGLFDAPGHCDLTAHVDFASLVRAARAAGADCHGPVEMGAFLVALGIAERARRLAAGASPPVARDIAAALARLTDRAAMGSLFRALAIVSPGLAPPPAFATEPARR